ncbi:MAG: C1 family peptidase [SAR202 cluster bacterium]|nr:C1 family peptidase [SAR202 cluster bacterium]
MIIQLKPITGRSSLPVMKKSDFQALVKEPENRIITPASIKSSIDKNALTRANTSREFKRLFAANSEIVKRYEAFGPSKNYVAPKLSFKTAAGSVRTVKLLHPDSLARDAVLMRRQLATKEYQGKLFTSLQGITAGQKLTVADKSKLTAVASPASARTVLAANKSVISLANTSFSLVTALKGLTLKPAKYPASCDKEEGTGFGGDSDMTPGTNANASGILSNCWWPLKWYTTCVRDQGNRGTCTAFGIIAAVESAIAVKHSRWVNLSEQDLYMKEKLKWFPIPPDWYGDGYNAAYSVLLQALTKSYEFPFERDWDYNQSQSRTESDSQRRYTNSCSGYNGEACSDTNHQAALKCYQVETKHVKEVVTESCSWVEKEVEKIPIIGGIISEIIEEWVCEPVTELIETIERYEVCVYDTDIPGTSGFRINSADVIWDPFSNDQEVSTAKAYLANRVPIVFCFNVPDSFRNQSGGYVAYSANETKSDGGHCACITGYIDNSKLPAGAPKASGGGYFILKNSWGTGWGDLGYAYLPVDWVNKWGTGMIAITGIAKWPLQLCAKRGRGL